MDTSNTLKLNHVIIVNIEGINGQGVGYGFVGSRKIFVDYTAPGDTVEATIEHVSSKFVKARYTKILTSSPQRRTAPCSHFGTCGGCQLQHLQPDHYTKLKEQWIHTAITRAGFATNNIAPIVQVGPFQRRRVVLKVQANSTDVQLGFFQEASHHIVNITECHIAHPSILKAALAFKPYLQQLQAKEALREIHITYHDHTNALDIVLCQEHELIAADRDLLIQQLQKLEHPIRVHWLHYDQLTCIIDTPISAIIGDATVDFPPLSFIQATNIAQERMTQEIISALPETLHVFDLYAGCGTFSFPLLQAGHTVTCVEGSDTMVHAINMSLLTAPKAQQNRMITRCLDLYHSPIKAHDLRVAGAIVINPPRNGATPQLVEIAKAKVPSIMMVSCSLNSLERDGRLLKEAGYTLMSLTPIDQFYWTRHTECVAHFSA